MKSTTNASLICCLLLAAQSVSDAGAAPSQAQPTFILTTPQNNVTLVISRDTDESALVKTLGKANVQRKAIGTGEGETEPGTVIYSGKTDREISIIWSDRKNNRYPDTVNIWGPKSRWRTAKGLHTGMPLVELQKLNGKPFTMSGSIGTTVVE